jgi:RimJ/RimL family protein N-acetyltransferase
MLLLMVGHTRPLIFSISLNTRVPAFTDVPHILELIQLLADYEHASDSVKATTTTLDATLSFPPFPSPGYARTLLIFAPEEEASTEGSASPAGMALYFPTYSTWRAAPGIWLEDLFVKPEYRGRGYGTRLLTRLAQEVKEMGGARLEWCVLKWNKPSLDF